MGADSAPKGFFRPAGGDRSDDPDWLRFRVLGATNPTYFGLYARRRMAVHGDTLEDFAQVKVKNAALGALNPNARYRKRVTADEVAASAVVADPLRLLDICATSDGGGRTRADQHGVRAPARGGGPGADPRGVHGDTALPHDRARPARHRDGLGGRRWSRRADLPGVDRAGGLRGGGHRPRRISPSPRSTTCPPPWSCSGTRTWGCAVRARRRSCCARARRRWAGAYPSTQRRPRLLRRGRARAGHRPGVRADLAVAGRRPVTGRSRGPVRASPRTRACSGTVPRDRGAVRSGVTCGGAWASYDWRATLAQAG